MFSLTRVVAKKSHRSNAKASVKTASTSTTRKSRSSPDDSTLSPPSTASSSSADRPKKRRRELPIPSFRDDELERLERAFLGDQDDGCYNKDAQPVAKKHQKESEAMPTVVAPPKTPMARPQETKNIANEQHRDLDSCSPTDVHDDDDSILEMEIFTRKQELAQEEESRLPSKPKKIPSSSLPPATIVVDHQQTKPNAVDVTQDLKLEGPDGVVNHSDNSTPNTAVSRAMSSSKNHLLQSSNRANVPVQKSKNHAAGLTNEVRQQIDDILAKSDFEQVSLRNVYSLLGKESCKGRREAIRAHVYEKIGISLSKTKSKKPENHQESIYTTDGDPVQTSTPEDISKPCDTPATSQGNPASKPQTSAFAQSESAAKAQKSSADVTKPNAEVEIVGTLPPAPFVQQHHAQLPDIASGEAVETKRKKTQASKQRAKKRETKEETKAGPAKNSRAAPKRKRNQEHKCCQICAQCPCRSAKESEEVATLNMTQSDHAVEKSLIKRLQKCEKIAERYATQEDAVRRQLKNHRRDMWRKRERLQQMARQPHQETTVSRFLPDVDEIEETFSLAASGKAAPAGESKRARGSMFGQHRPSYQCTLTQFMGGSEKESNDTEPRDNIEDDENAQFDSFEETEVNDPAEYQPREETAQEDADDLPEGEPVPVERIHWIDGEARNSNGDRVVSLSCTLWSCVRTGRPHSTWDRLFDDPASTENMGMDDLIEMLDDTKEMKTNGDSDTEATKACVDDESAEQVDTSMLTPRGQAHADYIVEQVNGDRCRLEAVRSVCPNWEENIHFVMQRRNRGNIATALSDVRAKRDQLERGKIAFEKLIEQHRAVLSLFEETLSSSLNHFGPSGAVAPPTLSSSTDPGSAPGPMLDLASQMEEHSTIMVDNDGESCVHGRENGADHETSKMEEILLKDSPKSQHTASSVADDAVQSKGNNWVPGRRSVESDAETLIPTASPRRSSIATCRSYMTPSTPSFGVELDNGVASQ